MSAGRCEMAPFSKKRIEKECFFLVGVEGCLSQLCALARVKPMGGSPRKTRKVAKQEVKVAGYSVIDPSAPVESADQRRRGGARSPSLGPKSVRVRVQRAERAESGERGLREIDRSECARG